MDMTAMDETAVDKTAILLIDHDRLFREGLAKLLDDSDFAVTAQAASVEEALRHPAKVAPALVLLGAGGLEEVGRIAQLRAAYPEHCHIVALATPEDARLLAPALAAGIDAFLLREMSAEALRRSLSLVMTGEQVIPTQLATRLAEAQRETDASVMVTHNGKRLSGRESKILSYLVDGAPNKVIANHLNITESTVKVHLKSILRKINVSNRTQAAIWALKHGLEPTDAMAHSGPMA